MNTGEGLAVPNGISPFEQVRGTGAAGTEYWFSRDLAQTLGGTVPENFPLVENMKKLESRKRRQPRALRPPPCETGTTNPSQEEDGV